jgi:hypothetical protein
MGKDKLQKLYRDFIDRNNICLQREKKLLALISVFRFLVFAGGAMISILAFSLNIIAGFITVLASLSLFLVLVYNYVRHLEQKIYYTNLLAIAENEIRSLNGEYSQFPDGKKWINTEHNFSHDIDLFGDHSLFQYLNRTVTGHGREMLASLLTDPFSLSHELKTRQEAISELSDKFEWRMRFEALGKDKSLEKENIQQLTDWLSDTRETGMNFLLRIFAWTGSVLAVISMILLVAGILPYQVFTTIFILNLLIISARLKRTKRIHDQVSAKHLFLYSLGSLMETFRDESFKSPLLNSVKKDITSEGNSAVKNLRNLGKIIQSFDSRLNPFVGIFLNGFLLWDLHCIISLEKWKQESKADFPRWLEKIGETDALISLSNFVFNNPEYSFPFISEGKVILSATSLGHPLIDPACRVCNDFEVSEKGKIVIVTGANMSGKSTFLRTISVNLILAMTGATVCASDMKFKPVKLFTSMRTTDSLSHNESYFYAELKRLKILKSYLEEGEPVFFVLDEILKGTNSADKSLGSKQFTKKLLELGGTGIIATHDTSICDLEKDYPVQIENKCFELEIDGEHILFDYKLNPGVTQKMNAALLMKQMGIA